MRLVRRSLMCALFACFASLASALIPPHGVSRGGGGGPGPWIDPCLDPEPAENVFDVGAFGQGTGLAAEVNVFEAFFANGVKTTGFRITDLSLGQHSLVLNSGFVIDYILASTEGAAVPNFANLVWTRTGNQSVNLFVSGAYIGQVGSNVGNMVRFCQDKAGEVLVLTPPDVGGENNAAFRPISHIDLFVTQIVPESAGTASLLAFSIALMVLIRRKLVATG